MLKNMSLSISPEQRGGKRGPESTGTYLSKGKHMDLGLLMSQGAQSTLVINRQLGHLAQAFLVPPNSSSMLET